MPAVLRRPPVVALLVLLLAGAVVLAVALARSRTAGCDVAAPQPNLPSQLRTLGGFDQAFDTSDQRSLTEASVSAATALHSDLAGATADGLVRESPNGGARYDAVVVPLSVSSGSAGGRRVVGVVSWLLDCSGRAYYDDVRDVLRTDPSLLPARYPTLDAAEAAARLGTAASPRLVYRDSPFAALWLDPQSGRTLPAGLP
jgi:RES domain-containing protein